MVSQDTFRGVVVETWPVDGIKHQVAIPSDAYCGEVFSRVAETNQNGLMDRSLFHSFIDQARRKLERPTFTVDVPIKCDRIERHTAEFHLEAGREYLLNHPNLKHSVVSEVRVFWRTIYLVSGSTKFAVARTNWRETTEYHVKADRQFVLARRIVEPMVSTMRHPFLLPMGTPTNTVFAMKAKQAIVPVTESWYPEGVSIPEFIRETNELMTADFCTMPTYKDYDIYATLENFLSISDPSVELREHKSLTGQGKGIVKKIQRQYSKPVFQTRGASYIAASRYDGFDKEHQDLIDTWEFCFRAQADGFIPKLGADIAKRILIPRGGDTSAWHYETFGGGKETNYVKEMRYGTEPSPRLESINHEGLDSEWRKEIARLTAIVEQQK